MRSSLPLLLALLVLFSPRAAAADEIAPALEPADLRVVAQATLRRLVAGMPLAAQGRLAGTYVAFAADEALPDAGIGCDDDGDHVIVVTAAMLRLASHLARLSDADDPRLGAYAEALARAPGRRLLPPPPGFFDAPPRRAAPEQLDALVAAVLARELARLRDGEIVCPHPTATREAGDDVWTPAEARAAARVATRLAPPAEGAARHAREEAVRAALHAVPRGEDALAILVRFVAAVTLATPGRDGAPLGPYARLHPVDGVHEAARPTPAPGEAP